MTNPNQELPLPLTMSDPHEGIIPHEYVVITRSQHCECCKSDHTWSELYAMTHIRPHLGLGKYISNLRRIERPKYRLPIRQIPAKRAEIIPFCHACYFPSLMHTYTLLDPPPTDPGKVLGFSAKSEPPPKPKEPSEKRKRLSTSDILELLK